MNKLFILLIIIIIFFRQTIFLNADNNTYINSTNIVYDEKREIVELAENSKINFDDSNPLETKAVRAAQGPGIQIVFNLFNFTSLTRFSPGSQMLGIPASLTSAIESPFLS